MERLGYISTKWSFFILLTIAQFMLIPYASQNFSLESINSIIYTTLGNSIQLQIGEYNIYFQLLSLLMIVLLVVLRNKVKRVFSIYVAVSYIAFAFIQNIAVTEKFGFSVVTVNLVMFLFVAYVWIGEILQSKNDYSFSNFKWKYSWMILFSLAAYLCPIGYDGGFDFNPAHFIYKNSATAFCLTTPLFLTIMTLNIPHINVVTYRITALFGLIIGIYNMLSFLNPHTINIGILHIPLLTVSLYSFILSYRIKQQN